MSRILVSLSSFWNFHHMNSSWDLFSLGYYHPYLRVHLKCRYKITRKNHSPKLPLFVIKLSPREVMSSKTIVMSDSLIESIRCISYQL